MVPVFVGGKIVARVKYTANLDHWDGHNWTCGDLGRHKWLTRLKDGRYVLIHGTQWQGERDYGEIISAERALQEVLSSRNEELLEKYPELKQLAEQTLAKEEDEEK